MIPKAVLPDFQCFLLSQKLAPEKNVPYLADWVSKFLAFNNTKRRGDVDAYIAVNTTSTVNHRLHHLSLQ
jgi:hypothetical protein